MEWLEACRAESLEAQVAVMQRLSASAQTEGNAAAPAAAASLDIAAAPYVATDEGSSSFISNSLCDELIVCDTFFSFAEALSSAVTLYQRGGSGKRLSIGGWGTFMYPVRFLSYGTMDDVAVNNTLRLVDREVPITDVVQLPEFAQRGMGWSCHRPPSLVQSLRDVAEAGDAAAAALCRAEDNHNPAWDAAALAAIAAFILQ